MIAFGVLILLVSIILILMINCCVKKCTQPSKKPDVEITKISKKDDGEGGGAQDSSRDDRA